MSIVASPSRLGKASLVDECLTGTALTSPTVQKPQSPDSEGGRVFKFAPRLLEPLKSKRVVRVVTHDLSKSDWRETVVDRDVEVERVGYKFGSVVTSARAPAAGCPLAPYNSMKRGSSTSEGGVAKRKRGGGETL